MCLVSKWRFPKKANREIKAYKVLYSTDKGYETPYRFAIVTVPSTITAEGSSVSIKEPHISYIIRNI